MIFIFKNLSHKLILYYYYYKHNDKHILIVCALYNNKIIFILHKLLFLQIQISKRLRQAIKLFNIPKELHIREAVKIIFQIYT